MMKKNLLILAVAAAALASCSSDEVVSKNTTLNEPQQKEIAFSPLARPTTRTAADVAGAIEGTVFPTSLEMTVGAYDVTNSREYFATPVEFAYNYEGGVSASSGYWGGRPAQYWPLSATQINFLAIANANVNPVFNAISTNDKTVTIAQIDNYAYTAQNDLMYARGTGEVTKAVNTLTFPDKVDMTFLHAQSYLVFRLRAADAATAGAISIKDILVKDAYYAGTATVTHTNWNSFSSQAVSVSWAGWTKHGTTPFNYSVNTNNQTAWSSGTKALTTSYEELGHTIVLPHATAGFSTFTIQYWYDGKDYEYEYTPASTVLVAGKKYIYDITMKLHEIFIEPSVEDWDDGGTALVDIPTVAAAAAPGSTATYYINCLGKSYKAQAIGFNGTETVTYALTTDGSIFSTAPATAAAADGVFNYNFTTSANTAANATLRTNVYTLTGGTSNKLTTITLNQYPGVAAAGTFKVAASTAASYTFQVYGLTPSATYTLAEGTDANNIMTVVNAGSITSDTDGVATINVTMISDTSKSATLTLTDASSNVTTVTVAIP